MGPSLQFDGPVWVSMGRGNDILQLDVAGENGARSEFAGKVHLQGGPGNNILRNFNPKTANADGRFKIRNFSTTLTPETAPTVSSTDPANNATDVALNKKIAVTFTKPMDPLTIIPANVSVQGTGPIPIAGAVAYVGTTMTFTPNAPLAPNTPVIITISTAVKDAAGTPLASNFVTTFTTGAILDVTPPTVSSTNPANGATGVPLNNTIAATFSKAMDPQTITAATVTVGAPGNVAVSGTVAYVGTTMTFSPASALAPNTVYTLKITTGADDLAGNALGGDFSSSFTTGATPDTTAPAISVTNPANGTTGVALNAGIAATFTKSMNPQTITTANVTLTAPGNVPVAGAVAYAGTTMTFTPTSALAPNTLYTAKISTGAQDLAGNALASNYLWNFTTGAMADTTAPTVMSTSPVNLKANVFINKPVVATFSEAIKPATITTATFNVTGPAGSGVTGTVNYDSVNNIATFTPSSNLAINTVYTARITGGANGVEDLAGNPLASDYVWTFTTGAQIAQAPVNLGSASTFAVMATSATTSTGATVINGDVGLNPGSSQGIPAPQINGNIHVDDQAIRTAQADLLAGYNDAVNRSATPVTLPGNMGGLTFTPGLYTNSSSVLIQGAGAANNVTLDAQGDPNAVFIFQMGSTLTTGPGAQVILAGGAKASNIFWQVGTSATLDTTTIFKGNILAAVTITVNNGSAVEGRLLAGSSSSGSVTIAASSVTVPTA